VLAPLGRTIIQWMIGRVEAAIFYGENARQYYLDQGLSSEKLFVAPNTQEVENMGFNPDVQRSSFLFVGRLQSRKRVKDLLHAFAAVEGTVPPSIEVEIVGDGPQRAMLQQLCHDLGIIERVTFHGALFDDEELKPIFQRSFAYVSPGHVGLGVLHSFAYGTPVVTRRSHAHAPEYHNIEDGRTGFLYDGSVDSLANVLQTLVEQPDLSEEAGRRGFEHYRDNRQVGDMIEGFTSAINSVTQ
jgi:glycosyltransferase involved in cell wall biosynthesis